MLQALIPSCAERARSTLLCQLGGFVRRIRLIATAAFLVPCFAAEVQPDPAAAAGNPPTIERMSVGAFSTMALLAYVDFNTLWDVFDQDISAPVIQNAIKLLRDPPLSMKVATKEKVQRIAAFAPFLTEKPPRAILLTRNTGERPVYVLGFRGSDFGIDWVINAAGFVGFVPSYYELADRLVKDLLKNHLEKNAILVLVGHSLGGGMAEYAAAQNGLVAVTFNSAHLSQPFEADPRATIHTFHVTGEKWWNRNIYGDVVHQLRLGGNFEQTRLVSVPIGKAPIFWSHPINRFHDWSVKTDDRRPIESGIPAPPDSQLYRSDLLRSMPNLVAEAPTLVRESVRRKDVNRCDVFNQEGVSVSEWPDVWDFRFRYGAIWDSYPAGGLLIENMRVLDPSANTPYGGDVAEAWAWDSSFSHPLSRTWSWGVSGGHRSLNYHHSDASDFSVTEASAALVHVFSRKDNDKHSAKVTTALAATFRRFKAAEKNVGQTVGGELATSWEPTSRWLIWQDTNISALRRAGVRGTNGTVTDTSVGLRRFLHDSTHHMSQWVVQARAFGGYRSAQDRRFANTQRGGGLGIAYRRDWFRAFVEPSMRWTRHHIETSNLTRFSDRESVLRIEIAAEINKSFGHGWRIMGWEVTAGLTLVDNQTAAGAGNYSRRISALQLSKQY